MIGRNDEMGGTWGKDGGAGCGAMIAMIAGVVMLLASILIAIMAL
jgi:hypothetical protein